MEAIWLIIFGFSICIWLISFNILACIISFFGLTFITMYLYKAIFKYEVMVAIAKDKRMQLLKNVINNIKYIKTRVWENFYHSKIFFTREAELDAINKSNFIFVVIVGLAWVNPTTSYLSTFLSMLIFNYKFQPAVILAYVKIFASVLKGMGYIPVVVQFFIELGVSLDRINVYLDTTELNWSWINQQKKVEENDSLASKEKQPFAIEMDLGNFYWNKMDETIMKKRRERSRKKRVVIRNLSNKGTAANDNNLFAGTEDQSMRSVSVQNSVMTMGTNATGSSLLSQNRAAPKLAQSLISGTANDKMGFQIMDVDMLVPKGQLIMVFGEIGSGKSSILYSIMNEMNPKFENPLPQLKINGEIFFVS
jgi:ATP-binding cassette, subfamily C (CFTR/MRP), member 1